MQLSLGKQRRLQQTTNARGTLTILAIDHRGPLRRRLASQGSADDLDAALARLKREVVSALAPECTAVLLDPEIGLNACVPAALHGTVGLLVALDTGSTGDPLRLETGLVPDWSVERIARTGASGLKLLVYYHPEAPGAAAVESLVATVGAACAREELPFFLEPLSFSPTQPGAPLTSAERRRVVVETARRLAPLGVDVLKAEFPVNPTEQRDEGVWAEACRELTAACPVPWALLSGGVSFDVFLRQTRIACEAGASGVIAGRALWNEAVSPQVSARRAFLEETARERVRRLQSLCEALARPVFGDRSKVQGG